jgi:small neutral amino acid transporter SnatA (MarC family)
MVAQASFCHALALITNQHNKEQQTRFATQCAGFTAFLFLANYLLGDMICQGQDVLATQ